MQKMQNVWSNVLSGNTQDIFESYFLQKIIESLN